jgi:opacity protein-like surface antigen
MNNKIKTLLYASVAAIGVLGAASDVLAQSAFEGLYIGLSGANTSMASDDNFQNFYDQFNGDIDYDGFFSLDGDAASFGGQVGYTTVLNSGFLIGLELSAYAGAGASGGLQFYSYDEYPANYDDDIYCDSGCEIDGSFEDTVSTDAILAARIGYAMGNTAFYGIVGIASGSLSRQSELFGYEENDGYFSLSEEFDVALYGGVVGAGVEHMLNDNISIGANYMFIDYGSWEYKGRPEMATEYGGINPYPSQAEGSVTSQLFNISLNYRF